MMRDLLPDSDLYGRNRHDEQQEYFADRQATVESSTDDAELPPRREPDLAEQIRIKAEKMRIDNAIRRSSDRAWSTRQHGTTLNRRHHR